MEELGKQLIDLQGKLNTEQARKGRETDPVRRQKIQSIIDGMHARIKELKELIRKS